MIPNLKGNNKGLVVWIVYPVDIRIGARRSVVLEHTPDRAGPMADQRRLLDQVDQSFPVRKPLSVRNCLEPIVVRRCAEGGFQATSSSNHSRPSNSVNRASSASCRAYLRRHEAGLPRHLSA
jgi:hypothetical protein